MMLYIKYESSGPCTVKRLRAATPIKRPSSLAAIKIPAREKLLYKHVSLSGLSLNADSHNWPNNTNHA